MNLKFLKLVQFTVVSCEVLKVYSFSNCGYVGLMLLAKNSIKVSSCAFPDSMVGGTTICRSGQMRCYPI